MSWIEKVERGILIITGDGRQYTPDYLNAQVATEYNIKEFNFQGIRGTKVDRRLPRGRKYSIELHFTGANHLDVSEAFRRSADDTRAWTVRHPLYGNILVHPSGLNFDNRKYNDTVVTGFLLETIGNVQELDAIVPEDKVKADKAVMDGTFANSIATQIPMPSAADIAQMRTNLEQLYADGSIAISDTDEADTYFNLFNRANAAVLTAGTKPLAAARAVQAFINYPAFLVESVTLRMDILEAQLLRLRATVTNLNTRSLKKIFEHQAGMAVVSMAVAAITPLDGDYDNVNSVLRRLERLMVVSDDYKEDLDSLQNDTVNSPDAYAPDFQSMIELNNILDFTMANLVNVATGSKQERTVVLEKDSNVVLLTHRFLGAATDENIEQFIASNQFGLNELLQVLKDRVITYYV